MISALLSAGKPLRLRPACSAAMADLLHFFPAATHFATCSLMPALGAVVAAAAAGAAGAAAVVAGAGVGGEAVVTGAEPHRRFPTTWAGQPSTLQYLHR